MELVLALTALVVVSVIYAIATKKSHDKMVAALDERDSIYRSCFLRGLTGILARMAKADGTVTLEEVNVATKLFNDMGLRPEDRELCFESFRTAKDANLPMSYYASLFAPYSTRESRTLIYEILWDITASDGKLDAGEAAALKSMIGWLSLEFSEYERNEKRVAGRFTGLSEAAKSAGAKIDQILRR